MSGHDTWAIIPARHGSSRFPGKPLARILGVPLVVRVFQRVATAFPAGRIAVATDDERIRDVCTDAGITSIMTSSTCLTGTDRVWEAARHLDAGVVVNVQGDEPMIRAGDIRAVLDAKRQTPASVINAMCRIDAAEEIANPNVPKVVVKERHELVYMSRAAVPFMKDARHRPTYFRQVCIYAYSMSELCAFATAGRKGHLEGPEDLEILRFLDLGVPVKMVEVSGNSAAVDEPADVARVERLLGLEDAHGTGDESRQV